VTTLAFRFCRVYPTSWLDQQPVSMPRVLS
jgi:hypothetical protein